MLTGKPRDFNEEEKEKFQRYYHDGSLIPPAFEVFSGVWAIFPPYVDDRPTYRFYDCGTNCLRILKYTPSKDAWVEVKIEDIYSDLYSILWKLTINATNK